MAVLSCLKYKTIPNQCVEYVHPWTDSCADATLGLLFHSFQHSLRTYATLYVITAILKRKKPSKKLLWDTTLATLQSTVFLTTHAYGFAMLLCLLRKITGSFNVLSVAFTPAFLSSIVAISLERVSRRPILCLYVTNIATETIFRMAVDRGLISPIKYGEVAIFTLASACLLYRFRGNHPEDSTYSIYRFILGKGEENITKPLESIAEAAETPKNDRSSKKRSSYNYAFLTNALRVYDQLIKRFKSTARSSCCPHKDGCLYYVLQGGLRMLSIGYGAQVALRTVLSIKRIFKNPSILPKLLYTNNVHHLGIFLGLFTATFRGVSCALRWSRGKDSQYHAIPAALLAGLSFNYYPDNTVALYIMWKALQMEYENSSLPRIPGGSTLLYAFAVGVLFQAALVEPQCLRPAYLKFLNELSRGQLVTLDRQTISPLSPEAYGKMQKMIALLKINPHPKYSFSFFGTLNPAFKA